VTRSFVKAKELAPPARSWAVFNSIGVRPLCAKNKYVWGFICYLMF